MALPEAPDLTDRAAAPARDSVGPVAYLGPTLGAREALRLIPDLDLRGPARRGDLYRDREAGASVFVLIDGVFLQRQALSPREVVDVLDDGAVVVGAASVGALRAAECWPKGMRGVGSIYRLYRRGRLSSDDEVILTFAAGGAYRPTSVPLINVRYALVRAVRSGRLERGRAELIARHAERLFYADRTWPMILGAAGPGRSDEALARYLASHDLKRQDALRALRAVTAWRASDPAFGAGPRRRQGPFPTSEQTRERSHRALAGPVEHATRRRLVRWLLVSGRIQRHLLAVLAANLELGLSDRTGAALASVPVLAQVLDSVRRRAQEAGGPRSGDEARATPFTAAAALRMAVFRTWGELSETDDLLVEAVWTELEASGELDAELFRWQAFTAAHREAEQRGLEAEGLHRFLAETEIAHAHGFRSWASFERAITAADLDRARFETYRDRLALAKRLRQSLFEAGGAITPPARSA